MHRQLGMPQLEHEGREALDSNDATLSQWRDGAGVFLAIHDPPPAVPVNLAPLTARGNPEEQAALPPYRSLTHSLRNTRRFCFLAHIPDFHYCRYITHSIPIHCAFHPSIICAFAGRVNTLHTTPAIRIATPRI